MNSLYAFIFSGIEFFVSLIREYHAKTFKTLILESSL